MWPNQIPVKLQRESFISIGQTLMVGVWNGLPELVVDAGAITAFKGHLHWHTFRKGLEGYGSNAGSWD